MAASRPTPSHAQTTVFPAPPRPRARCRRGAAAALLHHQIHKLALHDDGLDDCLANDTRGNFFVAKRGSLEGFLIGFCATFTTVTSFPLICTGISISFSRASSA